MTIQDYSTKVPPGATPLPGTAGPPGKPKQPNQNSRFRAWRPRSAVLCKTPCLPPRPYANQRPKPRVARLGQLGFRKLQEPGRHLLTAEADTQQQMSGDEESKQLKWFILGTIGGGWWGELVANSGCSADYCVRFAERGKRLRSICCQKATPIQLRHSAKASISIGQGRHKLVTHNRVLT